MSVAVSSKIREYYTHGTELNDSIQLDIAFIDPIPDLEDELYRIVSTTWKQYGGTAEVLHQQNATVIRVDIPKGSIQKDYGIVQFTQDLEQYLDGRGFSRSFPV